MSAVTSTERTIIVSSSTPSATAVPSSTRNTSGSVASTSERRRQHQAGRRDHATGRGQRDQRAPAGCRASRSPPGPGSSGRCCSRSRGRPGTRRRTAGTPASRRRSKSKTYSNEQRRDAERGAEGQDHRGDQDQRSGERPQQQHQDQEHHDEEHERDDHLVVAVRRDLGVEVERRTAADQRVRAVDVRAPRRGPPRRCRTPSRRPRRPGSVTSIRATPSPTGSASVGSPSPSMSSTASATSGSLVGVGHDLDRVGAVGQVVLGQELLARDRVELLGVAAPRWTGPSASSLNSPRHAIPAGSRR